MHGSSDSRAKTLDQRERIVNMFANAELRIESAPTDSRFVEHERDSPRQQAE